jgi:prevent-host-death family protein
MKEILSSKVQNKFGEMLAASKTEPITIMRYKQPVAVLVSYDYFMRLVQQDESYWIKQAEDAEKEGLIERVEYLNWLKKRYRDKPNQHVTFLMPSISVLAFFDTVKNETFEKMIKHIRKAPTNMTENRLASATGHCICRYKSRYIVFRYMKIKDSNDDCYDILCVSYVSANYAG